MIYENADHKKAAIENCKQVCANNMCMTVGGLAHVLSWLPEDCRIFVDTGVEPPEDVTLPRSIFKIHGVKIYDINDEG